MEVLEDKLKFNKHKYQEACLEAINLLQLEVAYLVEHLLLNLLRVLAFLEHQLNNQLLRVADFLEEVLQQLL